MVSKLIGKCILFGVVIWNAIEILKFPEKDYNANLSKTLVLNTNLNIPQILGLLYITLAILSFLEVQWSILLIIINLGYSFYETKEMFIKIKNLTLITGLLIFYNQITESKELNTNKKDN